MKKSLRDRIAAAILEAESAAKKPNSYGYLPPIIESLRRILNDDAATMNERERHRSAGALARLITESFAFSESTLGTKLLDLADEISMGEE
jgi:hypothetical protein